MDAPRLIDDLRPPNSAILWRRVLTSPGYIVLDGNTGTFRVSSGAFEDRDMSVAVAEEAKDVQYLLQGYETSGIVSFTAGFARVDQGQTVIHDPWPAEPAHALVIGDKPQRIRRAFAKMARW